MQCFSPFIVRTKDLDSLGQHAEVAVPCGKCYACLQRKRNDWAVRLLHESYDSVQTFFVTLTYNDEHLPFSCETGQAVVSRSDITQWFKNIRKKLDKYNIKFKHFLCAEYGDTTHRPHYHCLLFIKSSSFFSLKDFKDLLYTSWNKCDYERFDVQFADKGSFFYVAKYCVKGSDITNDNEVPTFNSISNGIGISIVDNYKSFFLQDIENNSFVPDNRHKLHVPRYIRDKVYTDEHKELLRSSNAKRFSVEQEEQQRNNDKYNSRYFINKRNKKLQ